MATDWGGGAGAGLAPLVADLGRIQADRTQQQGRIWGSSLSEIGNLIAQAPQREALAQERQARALELQGLAQDRQMRTLAMQREQAGSAALAKALSDPANHGDPEKVYQAVAAAGFPEHGQKYLDLATKHSEALQTLAKAKETQRQVVADTFDGADPTDLSGLQARLGLLHTQGVDVAPYAQLFDQVGPDAAIKQIVESAPENVKAKRARSEKAAEEAAKVQFAPAGSSIVKGGEIIGSVPAKAEIGKPGSFEDYVTRYAQSKQKPVEALTTADIEDARKRFQQADDRPPTVNVNTAPQGGLDEGGLDLAAARFRLTGQLLARDSKQNAAVVNAAAKQAKELGNTPVATIQKQAAYKADSASLTKMTQMQSSAEAFENKALAQVDIINDLSSKVPRTKWPIINGVLQAGRTQIEGDSNATQLANAIETFSEEYAKIMNGATGSAAAASDSSRAAAKRLINTAMSKGTMGDVLGLMQREMGLTIGGYDAVKEHITSRMGGTQPASTTTKPTDPLGIR